METYRGYITHDPKEAIQEYKERFGVKPTILLIRPDFQIEGGVHPLIVRSRFGMANGILATHLLNREELQHLQDSLAIFKSGLSLEEPDTLFGEISTAPRKIPKKRGKGRPAHKGGPCPHCGNAITNFEVLGFWYGWQFGIVPPYWDRLRLYVFQRDDYTCQTCRRRLPVGLLRCHHRQPKEEGGPDSARNLVTLCGDCHADEHPIMPEM